LIQIWVRYDDFEWGDVLGSGSYGEVVVAVVKEEARSKFGSGLKILEENDFKVAVKRLSIAFINKEQKIKDRTGTPYKMVPLINPKKGPLNMFGIGNKRS